jgi:hypothetical protein
MLLEILKRTPAWVFVLFVVLLALGYWQSRPRTVSRGRVAILPVAMIALSIYGVLSAFQYSVVGIAAWFVGVALAVLVNRIVGFPRGATYSTAIQSYTLPGSWVPLALMMTIFFTRYAVTVTIVRNPLILAATDFVMSICLWYGFLSGMFFSSALSLRRVANRSLAASPTTP